jgi:polysaccharide export outer membrane protein
MRGEIDYPCAYYKVAATVSSEMQFAALVRWRNSLAFTLALVVAASVTAQTPTPEQLEIFRTLSPDQQQALLEQLGDPGAQSGAVQAGAPPRQAATENAGAAGIEPDRRREGREAPEVKVIKADDTVLVEARIREEDVGRLPSDRSRLERLVEQISSRNPYQLDRNGQLILPGLPPISLSGLTERQASQRLAYEPSLLQLEMRLTHLPIKQTGVAGLKPFGYDLFDSAPSTFAPVTDVPVPAEYVIGPGDELTVQLYGGQNRNLRLTVSRDGAVNFPELGPIRIGGMTFNAARQVIESRVTQQMIGVQASVTMGETRTIRVLVTGEARQPGYYTVSGLATMTTALYASGGVKTIGSLRDIQLKRQGQVVRRLDLYDLLIQGDTSEDARLLPGDAIFIPPVGPTVSVEGEVKRPAIYELRGGGTVDDVVRIAGGLTAEADATRASLTQIDPSGRRVVLDVNLNQTASSGVRVENGAVLRVARLRPQIDSGILVEGEVYRPGLVAWRSGLRLTDVIGSIYELRPNADRSYILIRRELGPDLRVSTVSADLAAALAAPGSEADVLLAPRDRIRVFDLSSPRDRIIQPLLDEIRLRSDLSRPADVVRISGKVKVPGEYPLEPNMRVSDLLRAGGNLDPAAYGGEAELTRYSIGPDGSRVADVISIDLAAVRRGDAAADVLLQPSDYLIIKETPDWDDRASITLKGEVRFPGTYPIRRGETLRQVLDRAGGLTSLAFPEGSVFMRTDLRELEQDLLDRMQARMRTDVAALALQAANAGQGAAADALQSGQSLLTQLQSVRATGRLVIDLPGLLASESGSVKDVLLRDGDELIVPKRRQEVSVIGEVQNAMSHLFLPGLSRDDYIFLSGGTTRKADKSHVYVVRADGSVASQSGSWFRRNYDVAIKPGDTIVVPLNTERMPRLPFWQAVTQILYNAAVSLAAINSF